MAVDEARRKANARSYIFALNENKWAIGLFTNFKTIDADLVAIEHRPGLPPKLLEKMRGLAAQIAEAVKAKVILCPKGFDVQAIRNVPRTDALPWLRDLANAIDCDLVDRQAPDAELKPWIKVGETRENWTLIEMFVPVPIGNPDDLMLLYLFARFDGKKLLECTATTPSCFAGK